MATTVNDEEEKLKQQQLQQQQQTQAAQEAQAQNQSAQTQATTQNTNSLYNTQYSDTVDDLLQQYNNRKPFQYDVNEDALYQQMVDRYVSQGKLAMQDTIGQTTALTGGYGNSYAQNAGQQAYQGYLQGAYDNIPTYYQQALDAYNAEGDQLLQKYSLAADRDDEAYSRAYQNQSLAQQQVEYLISIGVRPSDDLISASGYSQQYIDAVLSPDTAAAGTGSGNWLNPDGSVNTKLINKNTKWWKNYAAKYNLDPDTGAKLSTSGTTGTDTGTTLGGSGTNGKYTYDDVAEAATQMRANGATNDEVRTVINYLTGDDVYEQGSGDHGHVGTAGKDWRELLGAYAGGTR